MQPHAPIGTRLEAIAIVGTMHRHAAIGLVDRNDLGLEADQISDLARERSFPLIKHFRIDRILADRLAIESTL
jgi:hypothetical protein